MSSLVFKREPSEAFSKVCDTVIPSMQFDPLYEHRAVVFRDIQLPDKSPRLRCMWYKAKHYACVLLHDKSIRKIELIKVGGYTRQRAYEPVLKQSYIIIIQVNLSEHVLDCLSHPLLIGAYVIDACGNLQWNSSPLLKNSE